MSVTVIPHERGQLDIMPNNVVDMDAFLRDFILYFARVFGVSLDAVSQRRS